MSASCSFSQTPRQPPISVSGNVRSMRWWVKGSAVHQGHRAAVLATYSIKQLSVHAEGELAGVPARVPRFSSWGLLLIFIVLGGIYTGAFTRQKPQR